MAVDLLTSLLAGLVMFALVQLISRYAKPLPFFVTPVAVLIGIMGHSMYQQYSWFAHAQRALPPHLVVAETFPSQSLFAPWSFVAPRVLRFAAIDPSAVQTPSDKPNLRLVESHLRARYQQPLKALVLVDCSEKKLALIRDKEQLLQANYQVAKDAWQDAMPDGLAKAACSTS
jgi:hypothetical protein